MKSSWLSKISSVIFLTGMLTLAMPSSVFAGESMDPDDWSYTASIYLWGAGIGGTTSSGGNVDVSFSTIVENLDMGAMGSIEARKGKLSILSDLVYLNLGGQQGWTENVPVGPVNIPTAVNASFKLRSWIVNLAAGYNIKQTESTTLDIIAGVRYMSMGVDLNLDLSNVITSASKRISVSERNWDAFVGIKGTTQLNENWYTAYRFDIGGGDSDLTWHAFAGIGYKYDWGNLMLGYRHLHYDYSSKNIGVLFRDADFSGPVFGAQFNF
jgi:hypothetical protein